MTKDANEILDSLTKEMTDLQYFAVGTSPTEQRLANAIACLCAVLRVETVPTAEKA